MVCAFAHTLGHMLLSLSHGVEGFSICNE